MKEKIIFSLICIGLIVGFVTGCGNNSNKKNESDVYSYLQEYYPNEIFKIINVDESTEHVDDGCKK